MNTEACCKEKRGAAGREVGVSAPWAGEDADGTYPACRSQDLGSVSTAREVFSNKITVWHIENPHE